MPRQAKVRIQPDRFSGLPSLLSTRGCIFALVDIHLARGP